MEYQNQKFFAFTKPQYFLRMFLNFEHVKLRSHGRWKCNEMKVFWMAKSTCMLASIVLRHLIGVVSREFVTAHLLLENFFKKIIISSNLNLLIQHSIFLNPFGQTDMVLGGGEVKNSHTSISMQLVLDPVINLHSNNHHLISRSFQLKVTKTEIQRWSTCTAAILDFPYLKIAKRHYFKCQNYNIIRRIWYVFIIKEQLFRNWSKGKIFKLKKIERGFTRTLPLPPWPWAHNFQYCVLYLSFTKNKTNAILNKYYN